MKKRYVVKALLLTLLLTMLMGMSASAKTAKSLTYKMKSNNGTYVYSGAYKGEKYTYLRFKVKETGVMRVTGYEQNKKGKKSGFYIVLCDKNKKRLDVNTKDYINYKKARIQYYTLAKGTYYFRLNPARKKVGRRFIMESKFTKMGAYVNQTAESREVLKNNTQAGYLAKGYSNYAFITASDPADSARWIQFYTDGEDPVELTFVPQLPKSTQGTFKATIYGPSYEKGKDLTISTGGDRYKLSTTVTSLSGKKTTKGLKKGYYYIEIFRENTTPDNINYANGFIKLTRK